MMQAQTIVSLACVTARVPTWLVQGGQLLNFILAELCQDYDFEQARQVFNFNFNSATGNQSGPYTMPLDWLRPDKDNVFYVIDGVPYVMIPTSLAEFNALVQQAGLSSYPANYAVDNGPIATQGNPNMYVWPPAGGSYPVTAWYYRQMPDITTPQSSTVIPWFPNQLYLLRRLTGELMLLADDERAPTYLGAENTEGGFAGAASILNHYLKLKDQAQVVKTVTLDKRRWGPGFDKLRNTKTIGW